eukprot:1158613-Pelagomonas_calceolata.AAC.2
MCPALATRMWGRLLGVAFVVPAAYFAARGAINQALAKRLGLLFTMGGTQDAKGYSSAKRRRAGRMQCYRTWDRLRPGFLQRTAAFIMRLQPGFLQRTAAFIMRKAKWQHASARSPMTPEEQALQAWTFCMFRAADGQRRHTGKFRCDHRRQCMT